MTTKTCETCRFWGRERAHDDNHPYGSCRRRPPEFEGVKTMIPCPGEKRTDVARGRYSDIELGKWPWTAFDDWCGEHEPRQDSSHD